MTEKEKGKEGSKEKKSQIKEVEEEGELPIE